MTAGRRASAWTLSEADARARLAARAHGVLVTLDGHGGPRPVPVVFALADEAGSSCVGVPVDAVKPKASTRLAREDDLLADPRASLLVEHWEVEDWSRLWWVRAQLHHVPRPSPALVERLADGLAATVPQYAGRPFHRVLVCRVLAVTGWAAGEGPWT